MTSKVPWGTVEEAVRVLKDGGVVVVPTDTCWGLAGDASREETVGRVLAIKGRPRGRPPAVFVPNLEAASHLVAFTVSSRARAHELLPGPVTILVPPRQDTPPWLVSDDGLVGIRWTLFSPVADVVARSGLLLTATSANVTGQPAPYDPTALAAVLPLELVDLVVMGDCGGLPPSTVIDLGTDPPRVVRQGPYDINPCSMRSPA